MMKHLFKAESNAMNFYIVEDFTTNLAIVVDWDLSEDEERELVANFENGTLDYTTNGSAWECTESAYGSCFNKIRLD